MKIFQPKDPAESLVITFDFSDELAAVDSASVSLSVISGTDPASATMLEGPAQVSGATVMQRVRLGVDQVNYKIKCTATATGDDIRALAAVLPVQTF
jgi:hypothetical protein